MSRSPIMSLVEAYKLLELGRGATLDEVKRNYRKRAFELHPDLNPAASANQQFQKLNEAYVLLIRHLSASSQNTAAKQETANRRYTQENATREREARERETREREAREREVREREAREREERKEKERRERYELERKERERREQEQRDQLARERRERIQQEQQRQLERQAERRQEEGRRQEEVRRQEEARRQEDARRQEEARKVAAWQEEVRLQKERQEKAWQEKVQQEQDRQNPQGSQGSQGSQGPQSQPGQQGQSGQQGQPNQEASTAGQAFDSAEAKAPPLGPHGQAKFSRPESHRRTYAKPRSREADSEQPEKPEDLNRHRAEKSFGGSREDLLREILGDPFARRVYEDIYSEVHRQEADSDAPAVSPAGQKQVMPSQKSFLDRYLPKDFPTGLSHGMEAVKGWLRSQIDEQQVFHLSAASLQPGAHIRLQIRQGLSGELRTVELALPPDFAVGKPVRLKGMGKKLGKWQGDFYITFLAK